MHKHDENMHSHSFTQRFPVALGRNGTPDVLAGHGETNCQKNRKNKKKIKQNLIRLPDWGSRIKYANVTDAKTFQEPVWSRQDRSKDIAREVPAHRAQFPRDRKN
jgi:hypothetical protein